MTNSKSISTVSPNKTSSDLSLHVNNSKPLFETGTLKNLRKGNPARLIISDFNINSL